jgi:hypothetical protein
MPHFECGAIDHSTTCPPAVIKKAARQGKPFRGLDFSAILSWYLSTLAATAAGASIIFSNHAVFDQAWIRSRWARKAAQDHAAAAPFPH